MVPVCLWVMVFRGEGGLWYLSQGSEDCTWTVSAVNTYWRGRAMSGKVWRKQKNRWYIYSMYGRCSYECLIPLTCYTWMGGEGAVPQRGRVCPPPHPVTFPLEFLLGTTNTSLWATLHAPGIGWLTTPNLLISLASHSAPTIHTWTSALTIVGLVIYLIEVR